MAETEYYSSSSSSYPQHLDIPPQRLVSDIIGSSPQIKQNPSKFFSKFLSKSLLVALVLVLLPLFPSQAPEFVNQTVLSRSWELLHLLFVAIAVSYGLFSRRNVDSDKENNNNNSKFDNTHNNTNYMSRILQVSSVFDDEIENPPSLSVSSSFRSDDNKIQTWNSQYSRGNPTVLVAQTDSLLDEHNSSSNSRISTSTSSVSNKPLLLPVRSLKSQTISESGGSSSGSLSRSTSGVKILPHSSSSSSSSSSFRKMRSNGDIGGLDPIELEEKLKESRVLPSPIPWRSRSGRIEMKEDINGVSPLFSLPPSSMGESEFSRVESPFRRSSLPKSSSSRPNSVSPSPRKLSPAPSLSPEVRPKNLEDMGKKRSHYDKSSPPPPPPPPPPPVYRRSPLMMSNSTPIVDDVSYEEKGFNSGEVVFKNELKDFGKKIREDENASRKRESGSSSFVLDSLKTEAKSRATTHVHGSSTNVGRSVRTNRATEPVGGHGKEEDIVFDKQSFIKTERDSRGNNSPQPSPKTTTYSKFQNGENKEIYDKVEVVDTDTDDEDSVDNDADKVEEEANTKNNNVNSDNEGPNPNEVDKKADEFIAKFREQIRLQRIASIKKSSSSTGKNVSNRKNSIG